MEYIYNIVAPNGETVMSDDLNILRAFVLENLDEAGRYAALNLIEEVFSNKTWEILTAIVADRHNIAVTRTALVLNTTD